MDAGTKEIFRVAIGCLLALAVWRQSRENWLIAVVQVLVLGLALEWGDQAPFPINVMIWVVAFIALTVIDKKLPWNKKDPNKPSFRDSLHADLRKAFTEKGIEFKG